MHVARLSPKIECALLLIGLLRHLNELDASVTKQKTWLYRNTLRWQLNEASRLIAKLNYATGDSSLGAFFDGEYTEAVLGYAFRPVR